MHTNTNCHQRKKHLLEDASTNKLLGIMIVLKHCFVFVLIRDHFTVFQLLYLIQFLLGVNNKGAPYKSRWTQEWTFFLYQNKCLLVNWPSVVNNFYQVLPKCFYLMPWWWLFGFYWARMKLVFSTSRGCDFVLVLDACYPVLTVLCCGTKLSLNLPDNRNLLPPDCSATLGTFLRSMIPRAFVESLVTLSERHKRVRCSSESRVTWTSWQKRDA